MAAAARQRLMNEYKTLSNEKWLKLELDEASLFKWEIALFVINPDSVFNGACLKAEMTFTDKYPMSPPTFKFLRPIWHPNIYEDGRVCISILHAAGEDEQSGELASERWSSVQSVESVLRSILVLLDNPEISSPANVDASVMYRDNTAAYNVKALAAVETSKQDIPAGFTMPTELVEARPEKIEDDEDFWNQSADEDDFGASDSSGEDMEMDEDEDQEEQEEESDD